MYPMAGMRWMWVTWLGSRIDLGKSRRPLRNSKPDISSFYLTCLKCSCLVSAFRESYIIFIFKEFLWTTGGNVWKSLLVGSVCSYIAIFAHYIHLWDAARKQMLLLCPLNAAWQCFLTAPPPRQGIVTNLCSFTSSLLLLGCSIEASFPCMGKYVTVLGIEQLTAKSEHHQKVG